MNEKKHPVFRVGDRVIGTDAFDDNEDIVGLPGTGRHASGDDMYAVEYDEEIANGHDCGVGIPIGYGWNTHVSYLAPYEDNSTEGIPSMAYDEVMI